MEQKILFLLICAGKFKGVVCVQKFTMLYYIYKEILD
jgi:hypothetical protein